MGHPASTGGSPITGYLIQAIRLRHRVLVHVRRPSTPRGGTRHRCTRRRMRNLPDRGAKRRRQRSLPRSGRGLLAGAPTSLSDRLPDSPDTPRSRRQRRGRLRTAVTFRRRALLSAVHSMPGAESLEVRPDAGGGRHRLRGSTRLGLVPADLRDTSANQPEGPKSAVGLSASLTNRVNVDNARSRTSSSVRISSGTRSA